MIIVLHNRRRVTGLKIFEKPQEITSFKNNPIAKVLLEIAERYPDSLLVWCYEKYENYLNKQKIGKVFHHQKIMASFTPQAPFLPPGIGYVEESPFIKINRKVTYPTWQMSSDVGGVMASVLLQVGEKISFSGNFDFYLNSLAKLSQPKGLFCYSEPALFNLSNLPLSKKSGDGVYLLFRFVRQHYKIKWLVLLCINFFIYERRFLVLPFLFSLGFGKRTNKEISFTNIKVNSSRNVVERGAVDVIIPTIGRKAYLYDVFNDLKNQTHLPHKVIVVEQNPDPKSTTELNFLYKETWPFKVEHIFTHKTGVCNARNRGLEQVESEIIFFNDDDNRFEDDLIEQVITNMKQYGVTCCITPYLTPIEEVKNELISQTTTFGCGNCFIKSQSMGKILFSAELEFGYGEDKDVGMQLRNAGVDIIYFPNPVIRHLKAPIGGFRTTHIFPWETGTSKPKPSPTLMWYKKKHLSPQQLSGYKTVLFLKEAGKGKIHEIFRFRQHWRESLRWANKLER